MSDEAKLSSAEWIAEMRELRKFHIKCESDAFAMLEKENAELRGAAQVLADAIRDARSGAGVLSDGQIDRALDMFPEVPHE